MDQHRASRVLCSRRACGRLKVRFAIHVGAKHNWKTGFLVESRSSEDDHGTQCSRTYSPVQRTEGRSACRSLQHRHSTIIDREVFGLVDTAYACHVVVVNHAGCGFTSISSDRHSIPLSCSGADRSSTLSRLSSRETRQTTSLEHFACSCFERCGFTADPLLELGAGFCLHDS